MTRLKQWKAQGSYRSFNTGKPMLLVSTDKGTVLEPLYPVLKCTMCKKEIQKIDVFSKGECLACHEKNFTFDNKPLLKDFINTIK